LEKLEYKVDEIICLSFETNFQVDSIMPADLSQFEIIAGPIKNSTTTTVNGTTYGHYTIVYQISAIKPGKIQIIAPAIYSAGLKIGGDEKYIEIIGKELTSEELKKKWLPLVASGKNKLGSLALTEPGAGSDLQGGVVTKAIKDGNEWVINGAKMWCTNASIAEYIITLVRTDSAGGSRSLSQILVPTNTSGLTIGPAEKKMGLHGSPTHALTYDNVRVPLDNLIGEEGKGLQQTLSTLDGGRIGIGAISVGLAQAAFEFPVNYARERKAFGKPIAEQQAIQWMLADATTEIELARTLLYKTAWLKEQGRNYNKEAAMAKMFATEMAERVCRNAIQIHGGYGYSSEYPVERIYRDARLMTIGEGTSEIQRLVIARHVLAME
jgi:alkylation response protein AidB-like acyl-CoA dehydrogenase